MAPLPCPTVSHHENLENLGETGMNLIEKDGNQKLICTEAMKRLPPCVVTPEVEPFRFGQTRTRGFDRQVPWLSHGHERMVHYV